MGKEDVLGRYYRGKFNSCGKGFKVNGILRLKDPNNIDIGINVTMNGIVHLETYSVYNNISTGYRPRIMMVLSTFLRTFISAPRPAGL